MQGRVSQLVEAVRPGVDAGMGSSVARGVGEVLVARPGNGVW